MISENISCKHVKAPGVHLKTDAYSWGLLQCHTEPRYLGPGVYLSASSSGSRSEPLWLLGAEEPFGQRNLNQNISRDMGSIVKDLGDIEKESGSHRG